MTGCKSGRPIEKLSHAGPINGLRGAAGPIALTLLALIAGAFLLCLPALHNGYPLIFPDMSDYAGDAMAVMRGRRPNGGHPLSYALAIWPLHRERSLWPVIFAQGVVVSHLIYVVLRATGTGLGRGVFVLLIAGLALLTPLAWHNSFALPDIFASVLILSLFLLGFCARSLGRLEKVYFVLLAAFSMTVHLSHPPLAVAILGVVVLFRWLGSNATGRPHAALAASSALVAVCVALGTAWYFWGGMSVSPSSSPILLSRVLEDGTGREYLEQVCPRVKYLLCDYLETIPHDQEEFLFNPGSPLIASGKTQQIRSEQLPIVVGTLEMFPVESFENLVHAWAKQAITLYSEAYRMEDLPHAQNERGLIDRFRYDLGFIYKGYAGSLQQAGHLEARNLVIINDLHYIVVALSFIYLVHLLLFRSLAHQQTLFRLVVTIFAALLVNALVMGAGSGVYARYQGRVVWLLPFAAVVAAASLRRTGHSTSLT